MNLVKSCVRLCSNIINNSFYFLVRTCDLMKLEELRFQHLTFTSLSVCISHYFCFKRSLRGPVCFGDWSQKQFFDTFIFLLNICGFLENIPVLLSSSTTHLFLKKKKKSLSLWRIIPKFKSCNDYTIIWSKPGRNRTF